MGSNKDGFKNENDIIEYINQVKNFNDMNDNIKSFLSFLFDDIDLNGKTISASKPKNFSKNIKPDIIISTSNITKYVSLKKGSGNSVHQETLSDFEKFLTSTRINKQTIQYLKEFHYADGTIDGTGSKRINAKDFTKKYPDKIKQISCDFNNPEILRILINRFLFTGTLDNAPKVDAIYHGTVFSGHWATSKEVLEYLLKISQKDDRVSFSHLVYQPWNRCLNFNPKTENRRHTMQIKWASLEKDLVTIEQEHLRIPSNRGTKEGNEQEIELVKRYNKNSKDELFKLYNQNIVCNFDKKIYLCRVVTKQLSKLSNQKVMTRADVFAITVNKNIDNILAKTGYYLDENILKDNNICYSAIEKSGISIKLNDSKIFQILKLTPNSFKTLFGNYELGAGASLFCKNEIELGKNKDVIEGWKTSLSGMQNYFKDLKLEKGFDLNSTVCKKVKTYSENEIKTIIDNSKDLQAKIFNGIGLYKEPYTAYYFFCNECLKKLDYIPFQITTGSGRSKHIYTLVLKPKI